MGIGLFLLNLDILQLLNNVLRFTSTIVVCADIKIIYIEILKKIAGNKYLLDYRLKLII